MVPFCWFVVLFFLGFFFKICFLSESFSSRRTSCRRSWEHLEIFTFARTLQRFDNDQNIAAESQPRLAAAERGFSADKRFDYRVGTIKSTEIFKRSRGGQPETISGVGCSPSCSAFLQSTSHSKITVVYFAVRPKHYFHSRWLLAAKRLGFVQSS